MWEHVGVEADMRWSEYDHDKDVESGRQGSSASEGNPSL